MPVAQRFCVMRPEPMTQDAPVTTDSHTRHRRGHRSHLVPCRNPDLSCSNRQPISSKTLKIGRYRAMIMEPTTPPRKAIISGSISAVSASVVASTSSS